MSNSGYYQRSSVAQTCNLLSQYLKGSGRLGITSANFEIDEGLTLNLLPNLEYNSAEASSSTSSMIKATDFFQDIPSFASSHFINIDAMESGTSQMTIFYDGKVLVFNDFSAKKAKEIMALANKLGSSNNTSAAAAEKINSSRAVTPDLNMASTFENNNNKNYKQFRKASLHRFFEKRKDRATERAPYQVNNPSSSSMDVPAKEP